MLQVVQLVVELDEGLDELEYIQWFEEYGLNLDVTEVLL